MSNRTLPLFRSEIRVAEYLVELPLGEMLEAKLHEAIRIARGHKAGRCDGKRPAGSCGFLACAPQD